MESTDREFILKMREVDRRLKRPYEEHEEFEQELTSYKYKVYLTTPEQQRQALLKSKKLRGVEKMMEIVSELRKAA